MINNITLFRVLTKFFIIEEFIIAIVWLALLKAQIYMISFQTCTQIFGIHKAFIHVKR